MRIMHEVRYWEASSFYTLTYRDGDLPKSGQLDRTEFTKFWKRLRAEVKSPLRYFGCGEYGERSHRPHYHAIIFGVAASESDAVLSSWGHGHCYAGTVTYESARYVADYVGAAFTGGKGAVPTVDGQVRPFVVMSKGIGRRFVFDHAPDLVATPVLTVKSACVTLPRYYVKLLRRSLTNDTEFRHALGEVMWARGREARSRVGGSSSFYWDTVEAAAAQVGKNLEARQRLRRGKV